MLVSGAGLLAFALVGLWGSVRDADRVQQELAVERAKATAAKARARLQRHFARDGVGTSMPMVQRFGLRNGELLPVRMPAERYDETAMPAEALEFLRIARQLDAVKGDLPGACKMLERACASPELQLRDQAYLQVVLAWMRHRLGQGASVKKILLRLGREFGQVAPTVAASTLLLLQELPAVRAQCDASVLTNLALDAGGLPETDLRLLEAELLRDADAESRARTTKQLRYGRRVLRTRGLVRQALPELGRGKRLLAVDGHLLWFAAVKAENGDDGVTGTGFVLPKNSDLLASLIPSNAVVAGADGMEATAVPVVQGLIGIRPELRPQSFWTRPLTLLVLLALLALCFAAGLLLSFRAMRRETAAVRSRADFLTSVTHELKTPLSSIRLLAEMLEEGRVQGEEKRQEYYGLLAGESARLTVLIENVLDLGRMERGERAYDMRPHHVDVLVREAVDLFAPLAQRDGIEMKCELAANAAWAQIDSGALVQALLNVMENARKYASSSPALVVASKVEDGVYRLRVRDHGPGIPEGEQEHVFQRFQRGRQHRSGAVPGVGLGLYLARTILRDHGGDLFCETPTVETGSGTGAQFVFQLPLLSRSSGHVEA